MRQGGVLYKHICASCFANTDRTFSHAESDRPIHRPSHITVSVAPQVITHPIVVSKRFEALQNMQDDTEAHGFVNNMVTPVATDTCVFRGNKN